MTENAALHPEIRVRFRPWFLLADAVLRLGVLGDARTPDAAGHFLVSSALTVIICRFRFNEVLSRADYWIRIAMQFNAKEDEIKLAALQTKRVPARVARRLELLHDDIVEATRSAGQEMSRLERIVIYMRLYRLLGVVVFAAILILGAAFFSTGLAGAFALLMFFVVVFPAADRWRDRVARGSGDLGSSSDRTLTGAGERLRLGLR